MNHNRYVFRFLSGLLVLLASTSFAPAYAHHSRAGYDMTRTVEISGVVVDLHWRNPHIFMTIETNGADGAVVLHEIEVTSVSEARVLGLSQEAIAVGAHVVARVHPNRRTPETRSVGLDIRTDDGEIFPLNTDAQFSRIRATAPAAGLAGSWAPSLDSFNAFNPTVAASIKFTDLALAGMADMQARFEDPGVALLGICEPVPPPLQGIFPDLRTIDFDGAVLTLRFDGGGLFTERTVHLDQGAHPANVEPSLMGHSIGGWENDTLVIDTVAFTSHQLGSLSPLASSTGKRLVERLTLSEDRVHIEYEFTLEDPENLAEPFTYKAIWDHRPDLEFTDEPCDPETALRPLRQEP